MTTLKEITWHITRRLPLADAATAFRASRDQRSGAIKMVLTP